MKKYISAFKNASYTERLYMVMAVLFILSLIPLLCISFYAHPWADDYTYGVNAHLVWEHTGSLLSTIQAAIKNTQGFYKAWQGTYASVFFFP